MIFPILDNKSPSKQSVFTPSALLREARRQKKMADTPVPTTCILDPDGDIVAHLKRSRISRPFANWPCYHTQLDVFSLGGEDVGIIGRVVGASYAVLIAEELFASGCKFLISLTSAGQISAAGPLPYFVLIDRALRDEGTSYHYAPPSEFADADPSLIASVLGGLAGLDQRCVVGSSWTTDAPFRETEDAIAAAQARGILAVEMEAAALYAFAKATGARVLCLAQVTNTMGTAGDDFEKGESDGTTDALAVIGAIVTVLK